MSDVIKVLIVDDSSLMRKLLSNLFEKAGDVEVVGTAMNGLFALQKAEALALDVIVLDIEMPEMNGIEFLKEKNAAVSTSPSSSSPRMPSGARG